MRNGQFMMDKVDVLFYESQAYNLALAEALKKMSEFERPEWSEYVRTGASKQRPSEDVDFWHKRAASILRQIYKKGILGVNRLRTKYGGRKNRGMKPDEFRRAGGKIIRTILQQCDAAGFTEKAEGKKKGRKLTKKGKDFMEGIKIEKKVVKELE